MDPADDDVFLDPASEEEVLHGGDDDDVYPPPESPDACDVQASQGRSLSTSHRQGRFGCFLVGDPCATNESRALLGVAEIQWTLCAPGADVISGHDGAPDSVPSGGPLHPWGYLQYVVKRICALDEALLLPLEFDWGPRRALRHLKQLCSTSTVSGSMDLDAATDALAVLVNKVFFLSEAAAARVEDGVCDTLVRSLALGRRVPVNLITPQCPTLSVIRRCRRKFRDMHHADESVMGPETHERYLSRYNEVLLRLPLTTNPPGNPPKKANRRVHGRGQGGDTSPLKMLSGLNVLQYLRSGRFFRR